MRLTVGSDVTPVLPLVQAPVLVLHPADAASASWRHVLFTDVVESTQRVVQTGDRAWAETLGGHLAVTRAIVEAHDGQTIRMTGDGVLALFTGPAQGVRCAERISVEARSLGLMLRAGLHVGEVERSRDDVAGVAVHLAARIMSLAGGGEILVSRTVRDLVIGSELTFADRGEHPLKGFPGGWSIYAVNSNAAALHPGSEAVRQPLRG